jgi:hypothetical protein
LNGSFNTNYRLPFERLYGRRILEDHQYRKEPSTYHENSLCKTILTMSPISQKPFLTVWFRSLLHSGLGDLRSIREFLTIPT